MRKGSRSSLEPPAKGLHAPMHHRQRRYIRRSEAGKLPVSPQIKTVPTRRFSSERMLTTVHRR
ncbi:hypothetical protein V6Z11_A13G118100 [Gossypium hirsutum]